MRRRIKKFFVVLGISILVFLVGTVLISIRNQNVKRILKVTQRKYGQDYPYRQMDYRMYVMNIPFGYFHFQIDDIQHNGKPAYKILMSERADRFLKTVSFNNVGIDFTTFVNKETFLPYRFEQIDFYSRKRGKKARGINYYHKKLFMERKGNKEDIQRDTHDPVSLIAWLMHQDYNSRNLIKSTLNINKKLYLVIGKAESDIYTSLGLDNIKLVRLELKILQVDKEFNIQSSFPVMISLIEDNDGVCIPILINVKKGFFSVSLVLN